MRTEIETTPLLPFHYPRPQPRFSLTARSPVHEHVHKCPAPIAQARATTPSLTPRLAWVTCYNDDASAGQAFLSGQ
eukprot:scaffold6143_cov66-Phaeocystis_antarctica.AAC.2